MDMYIINKLMVSKTLSNLFLISFCFYYPRYERNIIRIQVSDARDERKGPKVVSCIENL